MKTHCLENTATCVVFQAVIILWEIIQIHFVCILILFVVPATQCLHKVCPVCEIANHWLLGSPAACLSCILPWIPVVILRPRWFLPCTPAFCPAPWGVKSLLTAPCPVPVIPGVGAFQPCLWMVPLGSPALIACLPYFQAVFLHCVFTPTVWAILPICRTFSLSA